MRQPGLVCLQQNKTKELRWSGPVDAVHKQVLCAVVCCSRVYILQSLQVPHKSHRWSSSLKTSKKLLCINISRFEQALSLTGATLMIQEQEAVVGSPA